MIVNRYRGKCSCGTVVPPNTGFVMNRRIVCAECASIADDGFTLHDVDEEPQYEGRGMYGFDE